MEAIDWLTTIGSAYVEILHNKFQEKCTAHSQVHQSFKVSKSTFRDLISIIDGLPPSCLNQWFEALQDQDETSVDFRRFLSTAAIACFERQQARRESMDSDEEGDSVQLFSRDWITRVLFGLYKNSSEGMMDFDCFDQVIRDVHLVPLFFGNNQKSQPDLKEIVQTRWARRRQAEDFMSLADFCDAVADLELPPKGSEETDGCSLSSGQPRTSYPIVRLNGKIIPKANAEEKIDSQNRQSWVYVVKGPLKVTHLEVGLRRRLRDLVAKGGDKVLVEIITDNHVESESNICDTTTLQHDNNHRCSWPELKLRPFDVKEQLQVVFTRLNSVVPHDDGEGKESEARPVEVAEVEELSKSEEQGKQQGKRALSDSDAGDDKHDKRQKQEHHLDPNQDSRPAEQAHVPSSAQSEPSVKRDPAISSSSSSSFSSPFNSPSSSMVECPSCHSRVLRKPSTDASQTLGARRAPWKLASHTVKLNRYQGTVERFESLWSYRSNSHGDEHTGTGTYSGPHTPRSLRPHTPTGGTASPVPMDSPHLRVLDPEGAAGGIGHAASGLDTQRRSVTKNSDGTLFEMQSAPNQLLEALRFFELPLPEKQKPAYSWGVQGPMQKSLLARYIESVARDVRKICLAEPRCVHVRAPCYILGDLHGNYQDLIAFEKALWRIGPALSPANFLFLGDYVDRGAHNLEVITYLLAQKALCPGKIVLLRGNHEMRSQNSYSAYNPCFKQSCEMVLGEELGSQVWESVNLAFDTFPIAAIVDNSIFCAHGGIPSSDVMPGAAGAGGQAELINEINKIPRDLPIPDPSSPQGCKLAWDLMWNDPSPPTCEPAQKVDNSGFGLNVTRGTAHVFTAEALERFLHTYNLSYLVRAHEVRKTGFQVQQHSQMVTIFSSSGYCGAHNEACCILACEGKIRFIRLEHSLLPQLGSLASRAAAASAMVAALAAGVQLPPAQCLQASLKSPHVYSSTTEVRAKYHALSNSRGESLSSAEEAADLVAAAALAAAAVDRVSPQQMLHQRIQQKLQERLKEQKSNNENEVFNSEAGVTCETFHEERECKT
mmetsp:Transcript_6113/g.21666  ORF Transcript_6113/g.21666 Transcript_6113/m.21666 type:complete len:1054 (-) Transcript_6113:5572-8733(-)